jgi:hypothetical protein
MDMILEIFLIPQAGKKSIKSIYNCKCGAGGCSSGVDLLARIHNNVGLFPITAIKKNCKFYQVSLHDRICKKIHCVRLLSLLYWTPKENGL